ncbi:hypothetical protein WJX72_010061 [[Myrmecia] bisecta]|uniref:Protein kinase domain-containing protein n=1 Tax=[Myrmecia] bisecta TaxID=41462 RepID=A0AAW1Q7L8_9CHLO
MQIWRSKTVPEQAGDGDTGTLRRLLVNPVLVQSVAAPDAATLTISDTIVDSVTSAGLETTSSTVTASLEPEVAPLAGIPPPEPSPYQLARQARYEQEQTFGEAYPPSFAQPPMPQPPPRHLLPVAANNNNNNNAVIIGLSVASAVMALVLIASVVFCIIRRRRRQIARMQNIPMLTVSSAQLAAKEDSAMRHFELELHEKAARNVVLDSDAGGSQRDGALTGGRIPAAEQNGHEQTGVGSLAGDDLSAANSGDRLLASGDRACSLAGAASVGSLNNAGLLWDLKPEQIQLARGPDGEPVLLGAGAFGQVYRGVLNGVRPVAVKVVTDRINVRAFSNEIAILKRCRDQNIVNYLGCSSHEGRTMLVTELMARGDLYRALEDDVEDLYRWYRRGRKVALDIARGLTYLSSISVIHLDVKSPNILLAADGTAKIADVGLSRVLTKTHLSTISCVGTFAWAAPELLTGLRCTEKADIYSFGVILHEICTGLPPQRGALRKLRCPEECPEAVSQLIDQCMLPSPDERPTARQCFEQLLSTSSAPPPN